MGRGIKGFQPGNNCGRTFSSDNQPRKRGRKPALYKKILAISGTKVEFELSKEDYLKLIRFLMECTLGELKKIIEDQRTPIFICNISRALIVDVKYGRLNFLNFAFDRMFGKAPMYIEGEINAQITHTSDPDLSALTTEELKLYNEILEKISKKQIDV